MCVHVTSPSNGTRRKFTRRLKVTDRTQPAASLASSQDLLQPQRTGRATYSVKSFLFRLNCEHRRVRVALTSLRAHATHPAASIGPCVTRSREEVVSFNPRRCSDPDGPPTRTEPSRRHAPPVKRPTPRVRAWRTVSCLVPLGPSARGGVRSFTHGAQRGGRRGWGKTHRDTYFRISFCHITAWQHSSAPNQLAGPAHFRYLSLRCNI